MASRTITISVDPQTERAYSAAGDDEKRKIQMLLSLWLHELAVSEPESLKTVMQEAGREAQARGLTPEVLDSLLKGA